MKFTYYGHSAFTLSDDVTTILFDPFITDNPWTQVCPTDIACQYIIVTHCHGDHYGDTEAIAKANDATVISTAEVAGKAGEAGCKTHAMHVGGSADFPFGKVRLTPAFLIGIAGGRGRAVIMVRWNETYPAAGHLISSRVSSVSWVSSGYRHGHYLNGVHFPFSSVAALSESGHDDVELDLRGKNKNEYIIGRRPGDDV